MVLCLYGLLPKKQRVIRQVGLAFETTSSEVFPYHERVVRSEKAQKEALMKVRFSLAASLLSLILADTALANSCYSRIYPDEHLAVHPGQSFSSLSIEVFDGVAANRSFQARIVAVVGPAMHGEIRHGTASCSKDGMDWKCVIPSNGGFFFLVPFGDTLEFRMQDSKIFLGNGLPENDPAYDRMVIPATEGNALYRLRSVACPT